MFWVIHSLLGGIIGCGFQSATLIVALSLISHFLLDSIPHWDGYYDKESFEKRGIVRIKKSTAILRCLDFLATALTLAILYAFSHNSSIMLGAIVALVPDMAKIGYITKLRYQKNYRGYLLFHSKIQQETNWKFGLMTQIFAFIFFLGAYLFIL